MSLFAQKNYKKSLEYLLNKNRSQDSDAANWTSTALADACNVQKTYLSRVFRGSAHLNSDQLYLACRYLLASQEEQKYIELTHERDRSQLKERKIQIDVEIENLRKKHIDTQEILKSDQADHNRRGLDTYYFDPTNQLVHLFLTIDKFRSNPSLLCSKLGIDEARLNESLSILRGLDLIQTKDGKTFVINDSLHLPANSPLIKPYQILTRLKGLEKLQRASGKDQYAYSLFFSANDDVRAEILTNFLQFLKQTERLVRPAACERVYQLHFDLLDWGS